MRHAVLILMAFTLPLVGQTTWGGLRFGMTGAQVRTVMGDRLESASEPPRTDGTYLAFRVKQVLVGPASGAAYLFFDVQTKTLLVVGLDFHRTNLNIASEEVAALEGYEFVANSLLEKYGKPINETGRCPTREDIVHYLVTQPAGTIKCARLWRDDQQSVSMSVEIIGSAMFSLNVGYKAIPSRL